MLYVASCSEVIFFILLIVFKICILIDIYVLFTQFNCYILFWPEYSTIYLFILFNAYLDHLQMSLFKQHCNAMICTS